uniref:Uncharacterized protein n=1 Tax=Siphoviridae sp. ctqPo10 TaxID=2827948 RepID=A0A8S5SV16_9CAUD|nr:MAG TPA: hypothetical protein [Siphoviridae sp. ctqPo10]
MPTVECSTHFYTCFCYRLVFASEIHLSYGSVSPDFYFDIPDRII